MSDSIKGEDLTGRRFGMLTVLGVAGYVRNKTGKRVRLWTCACDCGARRELKKSFLSDATRSCGCLRGGPRKRGDESDPLVRIVLNTKRVGGCLEWQKTTNEHGYGIIRYRKKNWRAHRLVWTLTRGDVPNGLDVCHKCDNPRCCEPGHLFLGSRTDNMRDCASKGRWRNQSAGKTHCPLGHQYDEANTHVYQNHRSCRQCSRLKAARYRAKRAAAA